MLHRKMECLDGVLYKAIEIFVGKAFYSVGVFAVFTSSVVCGIVLSSVRFSFISFIIILSVGSFLYQYVYKFA